MIAYVQSGIFVADCWAHVRVWQESDIVIDNITGMVSIQATVGTVKMQFQPLTSSKTSHMADCSRQ